MRLAVRMTVSWLCQMINQREVIWLYRKTGALNGVRRLLLLTRSSVKGQHYRNPRRNCYWKNIVDEPSDYVKLYLDNTFWMYCWRPPMKSWNAEGKLDRIQILYYLHWGLCSCWDKSSIGIDDYDWISVWKEGIIAAIVVKGTRTTKA